MRLFNADSGFSEDDLEWGNTYNGTVFHSLELRLCFKFNYTNDFNIYIVKNISYERWNRFPLLSKKDSTGY